MFCTEKELFEFEQKGKPGSVLVYFTGCGLNPNDGEVDRFNRIRSLYNQGQVDLVQKKLRAFHYEYLAIYRDKPAKIITPKDGFRNGKDGREIDGRLPLLS